MQPRWMQVGSPTVCDSTWTLARMYTAKGALVVLSMVLASLLLSGMGRFACLKEIC